MPNLTQISTTTNQTLANQLADYLSELGALAVTLTDAKDEPLFQLEPEDSPLWSTTTVTGLFDETLATTTILNHISTQTDFAHLDFSVKAVEDKNWVAETQRYFHAQEFDQLWVCPIWEKTTFTSQHPDAKTTLFIEPGLAFGTGTHPTTQLCLTWLAQTNLASKTLIDYGCGSGILALGALALNAKQVIATDHDPLALQATVNNLAYNPFNSNDLSVHTTDDMPNTTVDIVIANILANPLIELAPTLTKFLDKNSLLVLSGLLIDDIERVATAYSPCCKHIETQTKDGWALIVLQPK